MPINAIKIGKKGEFYRRLGCADFRETKVKIPENALSGLGRFTSNIVSTVIFIEVFLKSSFTSFTEIRVRL